MSGLSLSPDHGYLILSGAGICFFGALVGGIFVGPARRKAFGKGWAEKPAVKDLQELHKKEIGTDFPKSGYVRCYFLFKLPFFLPP